MIAHGDYNRSDPIYGTWAEEEKKEEVESESESEEMESCFGPLTITESLLRRDDIWEPPKI